MTFLRNIPATNVADTELVSQYRETRNLQILGELYQRYMELVYGVCLKYLKEPETSRDAVMQIFEELVEKLKKHEVENFRGWLYQVARNYCLMQLRTPKNLKTSELNPDLMQSEENVHLNGMLEKEENLRKMEFCLTRLPEEQKKVIILFYFDGKCYNEIVAMTGLNWGRVRSAIQNGRRNLKVCMEKNAESTQILKTGI